AQNDYRTGVYHLEPSRDQFTLPSLKIEYVAPQFTVISNTSYFDRKQQQQFSYTTYQSYLRTGDPFGVFSNKNPENSDIKLNTRQKNFVQEVRAFSTGAGLIGWTAGFYYSKTKQGFTNFTESGRTPGVLSGGLPQYLGRYSYFEASNADDEQIAGYANIDIKPTSAFKVSLSARYTHNKFAFDDTTDGPIVGNVRDFVSATASENAFAPKFTATWQATSTNMVYATASKGFRPGGAQPLVPVEFCGSDLAKLGLSVSPRSYQSDTLWNYEIGTKNRLLGGRLSIDASAYHLKWDNIQSSINLPTCNLNFVGNLGSATGNGTEISFSVVPITGVQLGANLAYTHISYDKTILSATAQPFVSKGQRFGGPLWSGSVFGQIEREVDPGITGYMRADYSFATKKTAADAPGNFSYDPDLPALPNTNFISVRAGVRFDDIDISLFIDNLTNSRDLIARNHDGFGAPLYYLQTFRPRTVGLTFQFRH
ncbi:MAG TPA: TonB-dependent receptor, partial [Sphingomonas sp.]|nr:TonB-dependent receptor [Sphingomonas sp.]